MVSPIFKYWKYSTLSLTNYYFNQLRTCINNIEGNLWNLFFKFWPNFLGFWTPDIVGYPCIATYLHNFLHT
jgi:hypothetical protein